MAFKYQQDISFFLRLFSLIIHFVYIYSVFKDKKVRSHKTVEIKVLFLFLPADGRMDPEQVFYGNRFFKT
jgi:hypothetical protein